MDNKTSVTNDDLPDCWIKRPSKSHPDRSYYYNTVTKQSQWTVPLSPGDKQRKHQSRDKGLAESPKGNDKNDGKNLKISSSSKQIKKSQAKTPAQDRLHNLAKELKNASQAKLRGGNVAEQFKNASPVKLRGGNIGEPLKNALSTKPRGVNLAEQLKQATPEQYRLLNFGRKNGTDSGRLNVIKKTSSAADANKSKLKDVQNVTTRTNNFNRSAEVRTPHKPSTNDTNVSYPSDEIPSLFPPRTPGQNRLDRLRHSLNSECANTPSESAQHALTIIQSEFGLSSAASPNTCNHHATIDEDEPMDWEPCDVFEEVENFVYNESKHAYIVPDTNVFLDELSCIRDTIQRDGKYNVLVPFVVLQELDRLKGRTGDSRISQLASAAIRFIFNELKSKTQRLQGQKATEDCSHLIDVINADDKILNCCLQLLRQSRETILISNDINLCNKAIASGVATMTSKEYKAINN
ncbi:transcriptional protein SWT1-like [Bradysia coprophila]|uniref:transcriptional protein SWT1-like n=1 Tax=Bradysia coprophila TaxID=38358 RepID=UPI00187DCC77|nr:transcriptional protein SWT1-like [Bradysia coprophila]